MSKAKTVKKYDGPLEAPSVQKMLKRISKRTVKNPLKESQLKNEGQYANRIARRLASHKLVATEVRENGLVFFGKTAKA